MTAKLKSRRPIHPNRWQEFSSRQPRFIAAAERGLSFVALTLPQQSASTGILKRLGFRLRQSIDHPEDGEVWKWSK
ncbi:MAG: hypothetical protein R3E77_16705 [Steroidobacteraceae bacterium]